MKLLNRRASFGERDEQTWFSRRDQLSPLIYFARLTIEAIPAIAASAYYLTCVLVDEYMA